MDIYNQDNIKLNYLDLHALPTFFKTNQVQIFKDKIEYTKGEDPSKDIINFPKAFMAWRKVVNNKNRIRLKEENHLAKDELYRRKTTMIKTKKLPFNEKTILGNLYSQTNAFDANDTSKRQSDILQRQNSYLYLNSTLNCNFSCKKSKSQLFKYARNE